MMAKTDSHLRDYLLAEEQRPGWTRVERMD
jgi:hypothetical protein